MQFICILRLNGEVIYYCFFLLLVTATSCLKGPLLLYSLYFFLPSTVKDENVTLKNQKVVIFWDGGSTKYVKGLIV